MTVGPRGPILLQDVQFLDEMSHFDRERIPERVVHAKGGGAFGYFEVTHDITKYCKAAIFNRIGKRTPCVVRFSTVGKQNVNGRLGACIQDWFKGFQSIQRRSNCPKIQILVANH